MNIRTPINLASAIQIHDDLSDIAAFLDLLYMAASNCQDPGDGTAMCQGLIAARRMVKDLGDNIATPTGT